MLTRLRFKNWRSLRDVTIDNLTPITVFVGANSSGKTNILDALHFLRYAESKGITEAVYAWRGRDKIQTIGVGENEPVELEFTYLPNKTMRPVDHTLELEFSGQYVVFSGGGRETHGALHEGDLLFQRASQFVIQRLQLLRENFMPPTSLPFDDDPGDLYVVEPLAHNVPSILNFMREVNSDVYDQIQSDLNWLLSHVDKLEIERNDRETHMLIREKAHSEHESPTISGGTRRLIGMLTAYYALDMRFPEMSGVVVIEEPDMAIHPLLLENLVELLRTYTDKEHPRQFILTTHNPMLLNFFEPQEVRIVERDEHGETTVQPVSREIMDIWREKDGDYRIGDVWTTRLLGGVPE